MLKTTIPKFLGRTPKKFVPGPPRHINEARFATIDRKQCTFVWKSRSTVDISIQDRTTNLSFPFMIGRDAGKFLSCVRDGGIACLTDHKDPTRELRIGSDKGVLYFALKGGDVSITTGLAPGEAAIAVSLVKRASQARIERSLVL